MPDDTIDSGAVLDRLRRIDAVCDRFEREWQAGRRPRVALFAADADPDLIRELVRLDVEYRCRAGENPTAEDYAGEFPAVLGRVDFIATRRSETVLVSDAPPFRYLLDGRTRFVVGRSPDADLPVRDLRCSKRQFELHLTPTGWQVVPVSPDNPTTLNGKRITSATLLTSGDVVGAAGVEYRFEGGPPTATASPRPPYPATGTAAESRTVRAEEYEPATSLVTPDVSPVAVGTGVRVGRDAASDVVLRHPLVSRRHARIVRRGEEVFVSDCASANGTFVNGHEVTREVGIRPGDRIDIGPYTLRYTGSHLVAATRCGNVELRGWEICRAVVERSTGRRRTLLDRVSLVIPPGRFVCILGPSGSGKSTLLAALSGRAKPDSGQVLVNGTDLYAEFDAMKRDLAVVPQKDLLYDPLTVSECLTYTARLRLPPDSTPADITREVDDLLETVGLTARRDVPVRQLSGGQVKRVSLANELIGRPTLVFLDEVTSGLDEQTDREMMALFREMADRGKTVVCVTHSLAHVEQCCHEVVVLAPGGVLAFHGTPDEAKVRFGVERLGDVYDRLAATPPHVWREGVVRHTSADAPRPHAAHPARNPKRLTGHGPATACRHGWVLIQRRMKLMLRDRPAVLTLGVQTAVVAGGLALAFGDLSRADNPVVQARDSVTLHFLLAVSAFWFGCNGAVKVLVGDRPMFLRERAVNLSVWGYGAAAFALHAGLAAVQAVALGGAVWWVCQPPGVGWAVLGVLAITAACGAALGFAVSAAAESEEQAVAAVPLVLIPQIVFGGAVVALSGLAEWVAKVGVTSYWAQRASVAHLPDEVAARGGVNPSDEGSAVWMVILHLLAYCVVATAIVLVRDRRAFRR